MINDTLREMVDLMNKAKALCEVVETKNAEMQSIVDADNHERFAKMRDYLRSLRYIFDDTGWETLVIKTKYPVPGLCEKFISIKFSKGYRLFDVCSYKNYYLADDWCIFTVHNMSSYSDVCKNSFNPHLTEEILETFMNNWDELWEEIQNEFAKQIQQRINKKVTACMDKHEKLKKTIAEFKW